MGKWGRAAVGAKVARQSRKEAGRQIDGVQLPAKGEVGKGERWPLRARKEQGRLGLKAGSSPGK